jgi:hypothetical protein
LQSGILKRCEWHVGFTYQNGWDLKIPGPFHSQRDVTDAIKAVVDDAPLDCPRCEKMRDED